MVRDSPPSSSLCISSRDHPVGFWQWSTSRLKSPHTVRSDPFRSQPDANRHRRVSDAVLRAATFPTVLLRHVQLRRFPSHNGPRGHNWGAIRAPVHWTKLRFCHVGRGGGGSWCSHGIARVEAGCVVEHNATMVVRLGAVLHPPTNNRRGRRSVLQKVPAAAEKGRDVLL